MSIWRYANPAEFMRISAPVLPWLTGLAAVCLTDWLADGGSAVYSFFNPKLTKRSLGTWMILDLIDTARTRGLAHVYLGYWIENAPKMAYKQQFRPLEGLGPEGWRVIAT